VYKFKIFDEIACLFEKNSMANEIERGQDPDSRED